MIDSGTKDAETAGKTSTDKCAVIFEQPSDNTLLLRLSGPWTIKGKLPSPQSILERIESFPNIKVIAFNGTELAEWDSRLLTFLLKVIEQSGRGQIEIKKDGLPEGVKKLLELAVAVPEREGDRRKGVGIPYLARIGDGAIALGRQVVELLTFIGEALPAFLRMISGRARFRRGDFFRTIQEVGVNALPIVSLISLLLGLILAFVGAIQLRAFGAETYVADLVAVAMVREMAAIMTGIVIAGRTGAAFAAQLGTMQVNEEIDALRTLGISPMEFLVMPRMLALSLMMPLLCLYANVMGILGGLVVGVGALGLNPTEYFNRTRAAVGLNDLFIGIFMGLVFGVLISLSGCLKGMQCGKSSAAVGLATTSAVVTGIVSIIVATAIITMLSDVLGI